MNIESPPEPDGIEDEDERGQIRQELEAEWLRDREAWQEMGRELASTVVQRAKEAADEVGVNQSHHDPWKPVQILKQVGLV